MHKSQARSVHVMLAAVVLASLSASASVAVGADNDPASCRLPPSFFVHPRGASRIGRLERGLGGLRGRVCSRGRMCSGGASTSSPWLLEERAPAPPHARRRALELHCKAESGKEPASSRRRFLFAAWTSQVALSGVISPVNTQAHQYSVGSSAQGAAVALASGAEARVVDLGLALVPAPGKLLVLPEDQIEKSPADDKLYRALTLPNGLRVLLTSDAKADTAAAALNVHVGHNSDPDSIPGLAHFCEHMLFLGTARYPTEGELETYLSRNAGRSNAFTGNEETCYHFTVRQDALQGALERFSQFFVAPLFSASGVEREINAVNSEHAKNLNTDRYAYIPAGLF
jgi:hypothetical protein